MSWGAPAEAPGLVAVPWARLAAQAHLASRVGSCTRTSCSPPTPGTRRRSCRGRRRRGPARPHRWLLHRDRCPLTTSQGKMVTTQPPPALSLLPLQGLGHPPRALSSISMTPGPHRSLNACNLGLVKGLHISSGREVLLRVSSLPNPPPTPLLFLFTSSQGARSLRTLIFPVSQYLPNCPLLFSRAFPSAPALSPSLPPRGFYDHCRRQETAHGFLLLCSGCCSVRAEARGRQTGISSAESPGPEASHCFFQPWAPQWENQRGPHSSGVGSQCLCPLQWRKTRKL